MEVITGGVLLFAAMPLTLLALGGLCGGVSEREPIALAFGAGMGGGALLIGGSGLAAVRRGWLAAREESREAAETRALVTIGAVGEGSPVYGRWEVSAEDWTAFWALERSDRRWEAVGIALGFLVIGGVVLVPAAGPFGFAFAGGFGVLLATLWWLWVTRGRGARVREVVIGPRSLSLGGVVHVYRSDLHRFEDAKVIDGREPPALEIQVSWNTRRGRRTEEIRVPVPRDRVDEARAIVVRLRAGEDGAVGDGAAR
jgi:hypothetical protein